MRGLEPITTGGCYAKESTIKNSANIGLRFAFDGNDARLRFWSKVCCCAPKSAAPDGRVSVAILRDLPEAVLLPELCLRLPGLFEPVLFIPLYATVLR